MTRTQRRTALLMLLVAAAWTRTAQAQRGDDAPGLMALTGPDGIVLVFGDDILHPGSVREKDGWIGYHVYRAVSGDGGFARVNDAPVARVSTQREFEERIGLTMDMLAALMKLPSRTALWQRVVQGDAKLARFSLLDPALREALGLLYRDRRVTAGTTYAYAVSKVRADGSESQRSAPVSIVHGTQGEPLLGPAAVEVRAGDRSVTLRWSTNPNDRNAYAYHVYRALSPGGTALRLTDRPIILTRVKGSRSDASASFVDTAVVSGRTYHYRVVSIDFAGNESPGTPLLSATPRDTLAPAIPQGLTARSSGLGIALTWKRVADADLLGYHVYRSTSADGPFERWNATLVPPDSGVYEDTRADVNTQYFYRVSAVDRTGNESGLSARGLANYRNIMPPLPPEGVTAQVLGGRIRIAWNRNTEKDVQGYYVFRADRLNGPLTQISPLVARDSTSFLDDDTRLSPKGAYWYLVQAINLSGIVSSFSAPVIATPAFTAVPDPPLSLRGFHDAPGNRLFWSLPHDPAVQGVHVYRAEAEARPQWQRITALPLAPEARTYTDSSAGYGVAYLYHVRTVNPGGIESPPSQTVTLTRVSPPPSPPSNVAVTRSEQGMVLSWNPTMQRRVLGYHIYRSDDGARARKLTRDPLPPQSREYRDAAVRASSRVSYTVTCVGEDGRESTPSTPAALRVR